MHIDLQSTRALKKRWTESSKIMSAISIY